MSKRPNIQSDHEKTVEEEIQSARADRDAELAAASASTGNEAGEPEPVILSVSRGPVEEMPDEVRQWIETAAAEQQEHYRRIYHEIEALAPARDRWVEEFFERISGPRGFSVHAGTRRTIPRQEIPRRPDRRWRLVW